MISRTIGDHRAAATGPTLVVVGGLHANEPAGIEAAQRVHAAISGGSLRLNAGRFKSLRGNLAALAADTDVMPRYIDEDLNRAFVDDLECEGESSAEQRQRAEIAAEFDTIAAASAEPVYLLDLHTVSSESPPFVVLEDSLAARAFTSAFPLPRILGLEEELRGLMIDEATQRLGWVACIAESGLHRDPRSADVHEALIMLALESLGMIDPGAKASTGESPREVASAAAGMLARQVYDFRQRVRISHESFAMQPEAAAFTRVRARRTVLATEDARPITAEADGLLFMPNRQRDRRVGDDGFFVVQRIGRFWLSVSVLLRRWEFLHKLLPLLLPGVRRRLGDPGAIIVAPEYAAVLRREILHLLGYRLIRWHPAPYLSRWGRMKGALRGLCGSVKGIAARAFSGGEGAALPAERDTDWIARRRRLDLDPPRRARNPEPS